METTVGDGAYPVNPNPLIIRGAIYAKGQVLFLLKTSDRTLNRWEQAGLKRLQPGTENVFYEGGDLIDIMHKSDEELPPYKAEYKRKRK